MKRLVRDEVNKEITKWVAELTSKEEARKIIKAGLPEIERIAEAGCGRAKFRARQ